MEGLILFDIQSHQTDSGKNVHNFNIFICTILINKKMVKQAKQIVFLNSAPKSLQRSPWLKQFSKEIKLKSVVSAVQGVWIFFNYKNIDRMYKNKVDEFICVSLLLKKTTGPTHAWLFCKMMRIFLFMPETAIKIPKNIKVTICLLLLISRLDNHLHCR